MLPCCRNAVLGLGVARAFPLVASITDAPLPCQMQGLFCGTLEPTRMRWECGQVRVTRLRKGSNCAGVQRCQVCAPINKSNKDRERETDSHRHTHNTTHQTQSHHHRAVCCVLSWASTRRLQVQFEQLLLPCLSRLSAQGDELPAPFEFPRAPPHSRAPLLQQCGVGGSLAHDGHHGG